MSLPWIEKYRPTTLDNIVSHENIICSLNMFIKRKCLPHLLFYGPPGCGKTSTIMALAKELYGDNAGYMVMELNASDDRGIEVVREKIKKFVMAQNTFLGTINTTFKMVILDEIDAMTSDAQSILKKIVEEYSKNTKFCLICNCVQKIILPLQSRCIKFRFSPIPDKHIGDYITHLVKMENLKLEHDSVITIIDRSSGDMRKVLNILQSASMIYDVITPYNINKCLGYPQFDDMVNILTSLVNDKFEMAYDKICLIKTKNGLSLNDIITEIHDILIHYVLNSSSPIECVLTLSDRQIMYILDKLRHIELNRSVDTSETIQLCGLIGIFKKN